MASPTSKHAMEVEIKLRLPDAAAHAAVQSHFRPSSTPHATTIHDQENFFFDGTRGELSTTRTVLRIRLYHGDHPKATLTLKGKAVVEGGVSRSMEVEEPLDYTLAKQCIAEPDHLLTLDNPVARLVQDRAAEMSAEKTSTSTLTLKCLGGFRNLREEIPWDGHLLELDITTYPWGTLYELECETADPERLKNRLEAEMKKAGVAYTYSTTTKFANFRNQTLI
jgi:uncharacterized protein YjbK